MFNYNFSFVKGPKFELKQEELENKLFCSFCNYGCGFYFVFGEEKLEKKHWHWLIKRSPSCALFFLANDENISSNFAELI